MPDATGSKPADISAATSAAMRKLVADGLRQRLSNGGTAPLPPRLQTLLDEMRRRELAGGES